MTIINPNKNRPFARFFIALFLVLAGSGLFYMFQYHEFVVIRQEVEDAKAGIVKAQTENADLKDSFYRAIDPAILKELATARGMVLVGNPQYLNTPWPSTSVSVR